MNYKGVKRKIYTKKRKEKLQAGIYLRKVSRQLAFKLNGFEERMKFIETNNVFPFALFMFLLSPYKNNLL